MEESVTGQQPDVALVGLLTNKILSQLKDVHSYETVGTETLYDRSQLCKILFKVGCSDIVYKRDTGLFLLLSNAGSKDTFLYF